MINVAFKKNFIVLQHYASTRHAMHPPIQPETIQLKNNQMIILRELMHKDVEGIWRNFNEVVAEKTYLPVYTPVKDIWEKENWFQEIKRESNFCIVAENLHESPVKILIGQITVEHVQWEAAHHVGQIGIIVQKAYRKLGAGYYLIEKAKKVAKERGKKKLILSTLATNTSALKLYQKCGFQCVGRYSQQYSIENEFVDELLLECFLD